MANISTEVLLTVLDAHDDRGYDAPIAAAVRLDLLADRLFVSGLTHDEAEQLIETANAQIAESYDELEQY